MENPNDSKRRIRHPDRVTLSPEALSRLSTWITQAKGLLKGSHLTKSNLVNFLRLSHTANLSERELEQLEREHFDEVRFATWALRQLKEAKANGKSTSLAEIMGTVSTAGAKGGTDGSSNPKTGK